MSNKSAIQYTVWNPFGKDVAAVAIDRDAGTVWRTYTAREAIPRELPEDVGLYEPKHAKRLFRFYHLDLSDRA